MNKKQKNFIEYAGFRALYSVLSFVPYEKVCTFIENILVFAGTVLRIRLKDTKKHISYAFPEYSKKEINELVIKVYKHVGRTAAETYFSNPYDFYQNTEVVGFENMMEAYSKNRGVILLAAHLGNWELAGRYLAYKGLPVCAIAKRQRNRLFDAFMNKIRVGSGVEIIFNKLSMRNIISAIKRKKIVTIVADQNAGKDGILMDVFGKPASVHTGPARIAIKTGTPIVYGFAVRNEKKHMKLIFLKPVYTDKIQYSDEAVYRLTAEISDTYQEYIKKYPQYWLWLHKRWKGAAKARVIKKEKDELL